MWISKMLETMCSEFKAYYYEIVAGLESDKEVAQEQVVFDEHWTKTMEFINCLGDRELQKLYDVCKQHIREIEPSEYFDLDMFHTIMME